MRIILLWFLIGLANASYGQEFENASYFKGRISNAQSINLVDDETVLALSLPLNDSININNEIAYDTSGCFHCPYVVLVKYDLNNVIKKTIRISSKWLGGELSAGLREFKLKYINNKVILVGEYHKALLINDSLIIEDQQINEYSFKGIFLQFDENLNYERHFTTSGGRTIIKDLTYHNGEYILIGDYIDTVFQYQDFKLRQKYRSEPYFYYPECFVLAIDAATGKPIRGKTFGGPDRSETDEILVDSKGDFYITGRSGESLFRYDLAEVKTYENFIDATLYVMKISNQFDFLDFVDFGNVYNDASNFLIDQATNDIYISFYTGDNGGLIINEQEFSPYEDKIKNGYLVKLNNGEVNWYTRFGPFDESAEYFNGDLDYFDLIDDKIIIGSYFSRRFVVNQKTIEIDFDLIPFRGLILQLNAFDGELASYQFIAPPSYIELENFFIKPNGKYCLLTHVVETDDMHPVIEQAISNEADYMLVDMVPDLVLDYSDPFVEQKENFTLAPNPSNGLFNVLIEEDISSMDYHYNLMTTDGRILQSGRLEGENNSIHCDECGDGVYYVQLVDSKGKFQTKKITIFKN